MVIITITRWRKKLAVFLLTAFLVLGGGLVCRMLLTDTSPASVTAPDSLQKDVLTQPVKVQGPQGQVQQNQ